MKNFEAGKINSLVRLAKYKLTLNGCGQWYSNIHRQINGENVVLTVFFKGKILVLFERKPFHLKTCLEFRRENPHMRRNVKTVGYYSETIVVSSGKRDLMSNLFLIFHATARLYGPIIMVYIISP